MAFLFQLLAVGKGFSRCHYQFFYAKGICAEIFDMKSLESKKKMTVPFTDETLMKVTDKKKVDKIKGIEWFSNKNMYITETGELIMVLEKEYTLTKSYFDQTMHTQKTEYYTVEEDIICLKIKNDGSSAQTVIKRNTKDQSIYDYMLSCATFYEKGKLYVMYNEGTGWFRLMNRVFDENMKEVKSEEFKTYKDHDVYLAIRHARKIKEGEYKVFGREGKKVSSVLIKF
ncbi:MAG: hypothetical protein ACHQK8_05995 [Bacteroidia bacterium]